MPWSAIEVTNCIPTSAVRFEFFGAAMCRRWEGEFPAVYGSEQKYALAELWNAIVGGVDRQHFEVVACTVLVVDSIKCMSKIVQSAIVMR